MRRSCTRLIVAVAALLALTVPVVAQQYYVVELKITVDNTARGFADAASSACTANACLTASGGHTQAVAAVCVLTASSGTITYRVDGTATTTTTGKEVAPGSTIVIQGNPNLLNASFIRTGSTSGDLRCTVSGAGSGQ